MFYCKGKQGLCDIPCTNQACEHYDGTGAELIRDHPAADGSEDFKKGLNAGYAAGKTEGRLDAYEEMEGVLLEVAAKSLPTTAGIYKSVIRLIRDLKREVDS